MASRKFNISNDIFGKFLHEILFKCLFLSLYLLCGWWPLHYTKLCCLILMCLPLVYWSLIQGGFSLGMNIVSLYFQFCSWIHAPAILTQCKVFSHNLLNFLLDWIRCLLKNHRVSCITKKLIMNGEGHIHDTKSNNNNLGR